MITNMKFGTQSALSFVEAHVSRIAIAFLTIVIAFSPIGAVASDDGWYGDDGFSSYSDSSWYGDSWYGDTSYSYYTDSSWYGDSWYGDTGYGWYEEPSYYIDTTDYYWYDEPSYYIDTTDYYWYEDSYSYNDYYTQPYYDYNREYYVYDDYSYWYDYDYDHNPRPPRKDYDEPNCVLEASDTRIEEGDSVTLSWTARDADHATLTGFGSVDERSGSERVRPNSTRTYTLNVEGRGGEDTCRITIHVDEEEEDDDLWCELDASDTSIDEGDSVTLRWDTEGADDARINQGIGRVDEDGGSERVRPNRDTRYTLTVENDDGDEEDCSVTVRVDDDSIPPPPDVPLVYLSQLPYTGAEDTMTYWLLLIVGSGLLGYGLFFRALPFAMARVKMLKSDTEAAPAPVGEGEQAPQNVTRQDVRAFVSALAERDAASAREFAKSGGSALFAETAVVLDDVVRARETGTTADPMIATMTKDWDGEKFAKLIEAFADADDSEGTVNDALTA